MESTMDVDLHILIVPVYSWRKDLNYAYSSSCQESQSLGIIRVGSEVTLSELRDVIKQQFDSYFLPNRFLYLFNTGKCLCLISPKQENKLRTNILSKSMEPCCVCEVYIINMACLHDDPFSGRRRGSLSNIQSSYYNSYSAMNQQRRRQYNSKSPVQIIDPPLQVSSNRHSSPFHCISRTEQGYGNDCTEFAINNTVSDDQQQLLTHSQTQSQPKLSSHSQPQPSLQYQSQPQPSLQYQSQPQPSLQHPSQPRSSSQYLSQPQSQPKPSLQHQSQPQPSLQYQSEPQPSSQYQSEPQPSLQHQSQPRPSLQHQSQPQPSLQHQSQPQPSSQYQSQPQPSLQHQSQPQPSLQYPSQPRPSMQYQPQPHAQYQFQSQTQSEPQPFSQRQPHNLPAIEHHQSPSSLPYQQFDVLLFTANNNDKEMRHNSIQQITTINNNNNNKQQTEQKKKLLLQQSQIELRANEQEANDNWKVKYFNERTRTTQLEYRISTIKKTIQLLMYSNNRTTGKGMKNKESPNELSNLKYQCERYNEDILQLQQYLNKIQRRLTIERKTRERIKKELKLTREHLIDKNIEYGRDNVTK